MLHKVVRENLEEFLRAARGKERTGMTRAGSARAGNGTARALRKPAQDLRGLESILGFHVRPDGSAGVVALLIRDVGRYAIHVRRADAERTVAGLP